MNLILLGPPGAGKGTQAEAIARTCHVPQVSTGDIIRGAIKNQTPLGLQFKAFSEAGALVPDDLVNRLVGERLLQPDCETGFLLDGYPRTIAQAIWLDDWLVGHSRRLHHVLLLDVADEVIITRITGRRVDPVTGRIYHLSFDPPAPGIAHRLVQRADDTAEVLITRLWEYREKTAPLIPYHERAGLARPIDGVGAVEEVKQRVRAAMGLTDSAT